MKLFELSGSRPRELAERSYRDQEVEVFGEASLQQLLVDWPTIIPSEAIDPQEPPRFLTVKAEAGVSLGSMDILLVDHKAVPTVIETKLLDNREIRRAVLAQGLEYLAHFQKE